jgi:tetratricopeptide (TPR) repeat protein
MLVQMHFQYLVSGSAEPRAVAPKAEAAAREAIELDDTMAMAHRTLGAILHAYYSKWDEADREFRRALDLSGEAVDIHGLGLGGRRYARERNSSRSITRSQVGMPVQLIPLQPNHQRPLVAAVIAFAHRPDERSPAGGD